jgi:hypothetical protein
MAWLIVHLVDKITRSCKIQDGVYACSLSLFIIAYRNKSRSVLVLDRVGVVRVLWSIGLMNVNVYAIRSQQKQNSGIQFIQI